MLQFLEMRNTVPFRALVLAMLGVGGAACGSSSGPATAPSAVELRGQYLATQGGPFTDISFLDATRYTLTPTGCTEPSCAVSGTYALDAGGDTLSLTNGATGQTVTLPFQAISNDSTEAAQTENSIRTLSDPPIVGSNDNVLVAAALLQFLMAGNQYSAQMCTVVSGVHGAPAGWLLAPLPKDRIRKVAWLVRAPEQPAVMEDAVPLVER